jgi:hypothetical protein
MNHLQIQQAVTKYRALIQELFPTMKPQRVSTGDHTKLETLAHVLYMLEQIESFLPHPEHREKMMRWLGFAQGILWSERLYTLEDLKDHNR